MINDCAFVGETLISYLPKDIEKTHLKRSRSFFDKTFGLFPRIYQIKADIYHINYLLQDCFIALKLGKHPVVGHAHGSDLRSALHHFAWGRIVRYNLKNCDKILVSTPDVLEQAKAFREDSEYLPNPVNTKLFYPKPFPPKREKLRVLIASDSNWDVKGTDIVIRSLSRIKKKVDVYIIRLGRDFHKTVALASMMGLHLTTLPKASHEKLAEYFWAVDVVVDRFKLGSLGVVSLEAIASGRPVISYVSSEFSEYKDFPLKDANTEEKIIGSFENSMDKLWKAQFAYLSENHAIDVVLRRVLNIYETLA